MQKSEQEWNSVTVAIRALLQFDKFNIYRLTNVTHAWYFFCQNTELILRFLLHVVFRTAHVAIMCNVHSYIHL